MRQLACCIVCVGLLVAAACGNDIRIHFGQPEFVPPTTAFVPEAHCPEYAPPGTYTLGIWAEIQCDISEPGYPVMDTWNGIAINITSTGAPVSVSDLTMDNFDHRIGTGVILRWETTSDFGGGDNGFYLVSVTKNGLGGALFPREFGFGNGSTDWWSYATGVPGESGAEYHYWMGNVTLSCAGYAEVWFNPGGGGISRQGSTGGDRVFFGETDPYFWPLGPIPPDPGWGLPDFVFPEPGTLLLIGVVIMLLRRR
jgi:hypothetical protein